MRKIIPTPEIIYCPEDINPFSYNKIYHVKYFIRSCQTDVRDWVRNIINRIPPGTRFVQVFVSNFPIQASSEDAEKCIQAFKEGHEDDIVITWVEKVHNPRGYAWVVYAYAVRCYSDQFYDSVIKVR